MTNQIPGPGGGDRPDPFNVSRDLDRSRRFWSSGSPAAR
jgi:hypothetical protein